MPEKIKKVECKCKICGKVETFNLPASGFEQRSRGVPLSFAFPDLSAERIKQLASSICPECQRSAE